MRLQPGKIAVAFLLGTATWLAAAACAPEGKPVRHIVAVSTTVTTGPMVTTSAPTTTTSTPAPRSPSLRGSRGRVQVTDPEALLHRIADCEGWPDHINSDHPGSSSASGKYGVLDSTWDGYAGYASAAEAPEHIQDQWAREAYAQKGTAPWNASRHCWSR